MAEIGTPTKERKPLHTPRHIVQLPPRPPKKKSKWPEIVIPPFKTRPWRPPKGPKPKPKPVVQVPPVTVRRTPWKPPIKDRPHDPKKKIPVKLPPRLTQTFFPHENSKLGKVWRQFKHLGPKFMILRGSYAQTSKRFNSMSNDKQCAAISIVAIAFAKIYPVANWSYYDMDRIINIGDHLYRNSIYKLRFKKVPHLKPHEILPNFYIGHNRVTTLVGSEVTVGEFNNASKEAINKLKDNIIDMVKTYDCCILGYVNNHYAIWKEGNIYQVYNSHDCDENSFPVPSNRGTSCTLRIPSPTYLVEYFAMILRPANGKYEIYSVKVLKILKTEPCPQAGVDIEPEKDPPDLELKNLVSTAQIPNRGEQEEPQIDDDDMEEEKEPDENADELPEELANKPILVDFNQAYQKITDSRGILRCTDYIDQPVKVPCVNVAAIVMLRVARSFTWTQDTLNEIMTLGNRIYEDNLSNVEGIEVLATEIRGKIKLGKNQYEVDAEQAVLGEIGSKNFNVADLENGLTEFFKVYDAGVLQGPQSVAVWQEIGLYYMFDPKERDRLGRKWTKSFANESGDSESFGVGCVTWYDDIKELSNIYFQNVPLKHRRDAFRITKIEIIDHIEKSDDWHNFKGIALNKWILRGTISQSNKKFAEENRNNQATCMAAIALAFTRLTKISQWDSHRMDKIMNVGDKYYTQCVAKLKDDGKFINPHLTTAELDRYYVYKNKKIEFVVDDCLVNGSVLAKPDDDSLNLERGLRKFFKGSEIGILTTCGISLGYWKTCDEFYMFDSHARDADGKNPQNCQSDDKKSNLGTCCVLRFTKLSDMVKAIVANLQLEHSPEYNLNRMEFIITDSDGRPPLYNYAEWYESGAILRPVAGYHEGHKMFDLRANRQTLCNLIVALAMTEINNPAKWNKYDLYDMIKMGDKMFCKITNKLGPLVDDNYKLTWDDLKDHAIIGTNKFSIEKQPVEGTFVKLPEPDYGEEEEEDDEEMYRPSLSRTPKGSKLDRLSQGSQAIKFGSKGTASTIKSVGPPPIPPDLKEALEMIFTENHVIATLESDLFDYAIWLHDGLYYIYDPKSTDEDCKFEEKRIDEFKKRVHERKKKECEDAKAKIDEEVRLAEEEMYGGMEQTGSKRGSRTSRRGSSKLNQAIIDEGEEDDEEIFGPRIIPECEDITEDEEEEEESLITLDIDVETESEEEMQEEVEGEDDFNPNNAYVMWFTNLDDLVAHIMMNIPEKYIYEKFTLNKIFLENMLSEKLFDPTRNWYNFKLVSDPSGHWMIRASMSQNDHMFPKSPNRNNQDAPNCITALALATFCTPSDWNSTILDVILKYGDRLYTKSVVQIKRQDPTLKCLPEKKINLYQIVTPFIIANVKVSFNIVFFASGDITAPTGGEKIKSTYDALHDFFQSNNAYGVLISKNYYVAIWKQYDSYFMFDPHDIGPDGKRRTNGVACLSRFMDLEKFNEVFLSNLECSVGFNSFQLYNIILSKQKIPLESNICDEDDPASIPPRTRPMLPPPYSAFVECRKDMKIVHGCIAEDCCKFKWHRNPPTACNCIAALATSRAHSVEYWTPKTIDQVLILGDKIYEETLDALADEFNPVKDRILPQKVIKNFLMSGILVHVEMELVCTGIVNSKATGEITLKNGISKLFALYHHGLIIMEKIMVGVFKDCGFFYLFYPQTIGSDGLIEPSGHAALLSFSTWMKLFEGLCLNIPKSDNIAWFEIRRCDFTLSQVKGALRTSEKDKINMRVPAVSVVDLENLPRIVEDEDNDGPCFQDMDPYGDCRPPRAFDPCNQAKEPKEDHVQEAIEQVKCRRYNKPGFTPLPDGSAIVRGRISLGSQKFLPHCRYRQGPAICCVAIAMLSLKDIKEWSGETLDLIVRSGDALYRDSVAVQKTQEIQIVHLLRRLFIGDLCLDLSILTPTTGLVVEDEMEVHFHKLFEKHQSGYFIASTECYSVFLRNCMFYLFDPGDCDCLGHRVRCGAACVIKFRTLSKLIEHLLCKSCASTQFSLGGICTKILGASNQRQGMQQFAMKKQNCSCTKKNKK